VRTHTSAACAAQTLSVSAIPVKDIEILADMMKLALKVERSLRLAQVQ
jgi:hypothetical protein